LISDRFDRLLPMAGALAGLLFFVALLLLWNDPASETGPGETHQIVALLVAPLIAPLSSLLRGRTAPATRPRKR
jgi:hypothetical protein